MLVLAAATLWPARGWIGTDEVSYADMSDAVVHGRWHDVVNGYWSPAWAVLWGVARRLFGVGASVEAPIIRGVQLVVVGVGALVALGVVRDLRRLRQMPGGEPLLDTSTTTGTLTFWAFVGVAVVRLPLQTANPDVLLTVLLLGACWSLLRLRIDAGPASWTALGAWLAGAYLTKGIALPLWPVYLACGALVTPAGRRANGVMRAATVAALLVAPYVLALSMQQGRFDTGDTGRLTIAWFVRGESSRTPDPRARHSVAPTHPWTRVSIDPPAFVYPEPVVGTYAPWRDPVYWQAGVLGRPQVAQVVTRVLANSREAWDFYAAGALTLVLLAVAAAGGVRCVEWRLGLALLLPAFALMAAYLVVFFEPRYFSPAVMALVIPLTLLVPRATAGWWAALGAAVLAAVGWRQPTFREGLAALPLGAAAIAWPRAGRGSRIRWAQGVIVLLAAVLWIPWVVTLARSLASGVEAKYWRIEPAVAEAAHRVGVPEGALVAVIGVDVVGRPAIWWARRARLRIVGEVPPGSEESYHAASEAARVSVDSAFRAAGARYLFASARGAVPGRPWCLLHEVGFYVRTLDGTSLACPGGQRSGVLPGNHRPL